MVMITVNRMQILNLLQLAGPKVSLEILAERDQGPRRLMLGSDEIASGEVRKDGVLILGAERKVPQ